MHLHTGLIVRCTVIAVATGLCTAYGPSDTQTAATDLRAIVAFALFTSATGVMVAWERLRQLPEETVARVTLLAVAGLNALFLVKERDIGPTHTFMQVSSASVAALAIVLMFFRMKLREAEEERNATS